MNAAVQYKNRDLIWALDKVHQPQRSMNFVKRFENKLCVFSPAVKQIYTNYSMCFPESFSTDNNMVILPDPFSFHDTFSHINADAIQATGLHIIPGDLINKKGLHLLVVNEHKNIRSMPVPFQQGLEQILIRSDSESPFLPIITRGDLRNVNKKIPSVHLHRIHLDKLTDISALERMSLRKTVTDKLVKLYSDAELYNF